MFEDNPREYPTNHVFSFYMWCSSNYITEDYVYIRLIQQTITGVDTKWYVDQGKAIHSTFVTLAKYFLSYF